MKEWAFLLQLLSALPYGHLLSMSVEFPKCNGPCIQELEDALYIYILKCCALLLKQVKYKQNSNHYENSAIYPDAILKHRRACYCQAIHSKAWRF